MSTHHDIIWTSADGQRTIDMSGEYPYADHGAAIVAARSELLAQCADDEQRDAIMAGNIAWSEGSAWNLESNGIPAITIDQVSWHWSKKP